MALTEVQKARLVVKIDALKKERDELTVKLKEMSDFHIAAWKEYGSELSSGGMREEERGLEEKVRLVSEHIALFDGVFQSGGADPGEESRLRNRLADINTQTEYLAAKHASLERRLTELKTIKEFLGES